MLDHVCLVVHDLTRSAAFYESALAPLGHTNVIAYPGHEGHAALRGFGDEQEAYLLLKTGTPHPETVHLAFAAPNERAVTAFYEAALAEGGQDNGPPGPRPKYFAGYYAAYVLDPDGYNVEAVFQKRRRSL